MQVTIWGSVAMGEVTRSGLGAEGKLCVCFSSFTSVLVLPWEILS